MEVLDLDKNMKFWGWFTEDIQKVTKSMEFQEFFILQGMVIQSVETFRSLKAVGLLDKWSLIKILFIQK